MTDKVQLIRAEVERLITYLGEQRDALLEGLIMRYKLQWNWKRCKRTKTIYEKL